MDIDAMFAPIDPGAAVLADVVEAAEFEPMIPPTGLNKDEIHHPALGQPSYVWPYHNPAGVLEGYICRFETVCKDGESDKKTFLPRRYGCLRTNGQARTGWHWKGWGEGRPLYGLRELLARPEALVIVVEGEKVADAARQLFPNCVAVSPMNGARSPQKTDWSHIANRRVVVWPDNDRPGQDFADTVVNLTRAAGAADIAVVEVPQEWPEKWDLADPPPAGVETGTLIDLLDNAKRLAARPNHHAKGTASEEEIVAEARRLAAASPVSREIERATVAEKLGIRASVLDRLVKREGGIDDHRKPPSQGQAVDIPEADPWQSPLDGGVLLDDLARAIREYVILSPHQADAVALWALFTHAFEAFDFSPKLVISSPEKRSGKTRLVEVVERLVRRPLFVSGISPAALLRVIEQHAPAMLIDEVDTLMGGDADMAEALRGLINSGFSRAGARIIKNVPSPEGGYEPRAFSTWCPMLLAGIGKLPDTVADRSVIIAMVRKRPNETVKRLRARDGSEMRDLCRKAARWAADHFDAIKDADPSAPEQLHDRAADAWSPLLAIADLAGNGWPDRARQAAIELTGSGEDLATPREMLLADLRELFKAEPSGVLFTREIIAELNKREDRPWPEWKTGKPITARQFASLLRPLGVRTNQTVRRGLDHDKGYHAEWFADAFARYLLLPIGDIGDIIENASFFGNSIGDNLPRLSPIENVGKPQNSLVVTDVTDRSSQKGYARASPSVTNSSDAEIGDMPEEPDIPFCGDDGCLDRMADASDGLSRMNERLPPTQTHGPPRGRTRL